MKLRVIRNLTAESNDTSRSGKGEATAFDQCAEELEDFCSSSATQIPWQYRKSFENRRFPVVLAPRRQKVLTRLHTFWRFHWRWWSDLFQSLPSNSHSVGHDNEQVRLRGTCKYPPSHWPSLPLADRIFLFGLIRKATFGLFMNKLPATNMSYVAALPASKWPFDPPFRVIESLKKLRLSRAAVSLLCAKVIHPDSTTNESSGPKTGAWNDWKKHMNHMNMPYKCPYGVFFWGEVFSARAYCIWSNQIW